MLTNCNTTFFSSPPKYKWSTANYKAIASMPISHNKQARYLWSELGSGIIQCAPNVICRTERFVSSKLNRYNAAADCIKSLTPRSSCLCEQMEFLLICRVVFYLHAVERALPLKDPVQRIEFAQHNLPACVCSWVKGKTIRKVC